MEGDEEQGQEFELEDMSDDNAGGSDDSDGAPEDFSADSDGDGDAVDQVALDDLDAVRTATDLEAVYDITVNVSAVLGKTHIQVSDLMKLGKGTVVELDRKVGEAIDIYVNNRLVARGEVVMVEDRLGVTMTEIIKAERY
jgi:flagellar motor switch protein FliN/FliY